MRLVFTVLILLWGHFAVNAQQTDKVAADSILHEMLSKPSITENWHPQLIITDSLLVPMAEHGLYLQKGPCFQIASLCSGFYVKKLENGGWQVVNDARYPLETMTNLLLNRITDNMHQILLRHHQYGGNIRRILMPMQNLYDALARNMDIYCSITAIDTIHIEGVLVFHHRRLNFIHMLQIALPTTKLMNRESTIEADIYTNIPQSNIKSLFYEKLQKNGKE